MNHRGSGGYGLAFEQAGYRRWGDRMVEDIADATRYAIQQGWADPRRISIFGASFGGYAALQSAAVDPGLYRCAVGYAGAYDLERWMDREETITSRQARGFYREAIGSSPEELRRASPAYHADRITARVLLVHGEEDRRVPFDQAERMRKALAAAGRPPEWLAEPREGHGFYGEEARERLYQRVLGFLRECSRAEPKEPAPAAAP